MALIAPDMLTSSVMLGYIGPGAGFELAGSFLAVFGAFVSAVSMVLLWPIRRLIRVLFRRRPPGESRFKRVVILGLDGLDYGLTQQWLNEGRLPNLAALKECGSFHALGSTLPPDSAARLTRFIHHETHGIHGKSVEAWCSRNRQPS